MGFFHKARKVPELNVTTENEMFKIVPGKEQGYAAILIDKRANEPLMCYKFYEQEVRKNGNAMKSVKEKGPDTKTVLILDRIDTGFYCNCDRERVEKVIISLGKDELGKIIEEREPLQLKCRFCNKAYDFSAEEIRALGKKLGIK